MRCRNGTRDPSGDFDCLYGFPCDASTGMCDCSSGAMWFKHDTVLLRIPNCGVPVIGLYVGYFLAGGFALLVAALSLREARERKTSTKQFLYVGAFWTFLIPFVQLANHLDGNEFGVATAVLFYVTIQAVNVQVIMFTFQILSLLALLSKPTVVVRLKTGMLWWLGFWSLAKIGPAIALLVGITASDEEIINRAIFSWALLLMIEVAINTSCQHFAIRALTKELHNAARSDSSYFRLDKIKAVMEFATRLERVLPVALVYGLIVWAMGAVFLGLYSKFGFAIPHLWIVYVVLMCSWPALALNCVLLMRDATVKTLEKMQPTNDQDDHTFSLFQDHGKILRDQHQQHISRGAGAIKPLEAIVEAFPDPTLNPLRGDAASNSLLPISSLGSDTATPLVQRPSLSV